MIPQLAMLAPVTATGPMGRQAADVELNADESPLALLFGDLLGAMAAQPSPLAAEQQAVDTTAGFLTPLADGIPAADVLAADAALAAPEPAPLSGFWVLLAEAGLADEATAARGQSVASLALQAQASGPMEPRLVTSSLVAPNADEAALVASAAADAADAPELLLQGLATAAGQPALTTDTAGGDTLASALQALPGERLEAAPARQTMALPLPSQEARAAFTQTLDQVVWMTREGVHQARLQLEPAHLGRVDIRLDLDGGEAKLHLGAQQVQVREALEAVLPRLRDALAQHGMSLTDASVSDSGRQQPEYSDRREPSALPTTAGSDPNVADGGELRSGTPASRNLLDLYA